MLEDNAYCVQSFENAFINAFNCVIATIRGKPLELYQTLLPI